MAKSKTTVKTPYRLLGSLTWLSLVIMSLLTMRIEFSSSSRYIFLYWNLTLAIVPALLAWVLTWQVRVRGWLNWRSVALTVAWVLFLPNSFYLMTDLIHLRVNYEADIFFDISLLLGFIITGLIYGFIGVYIVHQELNKRLREFHAYSAVGLLFLAVSFAICLGRYTRWNSWDIFLRPAGLLFDVSDRFINPQMHQLTYQTTMVLFALLFSIYIVLYETARLLRRP